MSGDIAVTYTSRKPPAAWIAELTEAGLADAARSQPVTLFEGSAPEAAALYPRNLNAGLTVALAAGIDRTRVRVVADPSVTTNTHEIEVTGGCRRRFPALRQQALSGQSQDVDDHRAEPCLRRAATLRTDAVRPSHARSSERDESIEPPMSLIEALPFADLCLDCSALTSGSDLSEQAWTKEAIALLTGDGRRSADTHLVKPNFPGLPGIDIYFKDESTHPTGSLKHRLARSLFLYGICNGAIRQGHDPGRGLVGLDGGERGVFRAVPETALHRRDAAHDQPGKGRRHSALRRALRLRRSRRRHLRRGDPHRRRNRRLLSRPVHLSPSGRPTGAATTTSPRASSSRCRARCTPCRHGW
jgi:hypothetical protein